MILTEKLLLLAVFLQTLELWQIRHVFSDQGIWRARVLQQFGPAWARKFVLPAKNFEALLALRLVMILSAIFWPSSSIFLFLFASQLLILIRIQGLFNGGSDALTTLALTAVWIFKSYPSPSLISQGALLYLGIQVGLSYFIAGIVKIKNRNWWTGRALRQFLLAEKYEIPKSWKDRARQKSWILKWGSWAILFFEISFPIIYFFPQLLWPWLAVGGIFHFMNFRIFGLNRFFWIWIACYPAVIETAQWLSSRQF